jgi:uncharacterized LabA/DUF88 family protein
MGRIKVFVDFWNFQLSMNERQAVASKVEDPRVKIDWIKLGPAFAAKAAETAHVSQHSYEGTLVYASYNPRADDKGFFKWITGFLNRQAGIQVHCSERKPKAPPSCPACHRRIEVCPHADCGKKIIGTVEKGVDTLIVTDMIRLAWENAYDLAVLVSSDRDFIPAVKFLDQKGLKVIQAGFPPRGADLAGACWASFDAYSLKDDIIRK